MPTITVHLGFITADAGCSEVHPAPSPRKNIAGQTIMRTFAKRSGSQQPKKDCPSNFQLGSPWGFLYIFGIRNIRMPWGATLLE